MNLSLFLLGPFLIWLPSVFMGGIIAISSFLFFFNGNIKWFRRFIIVTVAFRIFYALLLTISQYYVWASQEFTKFLLNSPLDSKVSLPDVLNAVPFIFQNKLGYFLFYSYGRFWMNVILALIAAFLFWRFLKVLKGYEERFFTEGEVELGLLMALTAGWPNFVIFVPVVFILVVILSLYRLVFLQKSYTTLGFLFVPAAVITLISGPDLVKLLHLTVLKI